MNHANKNLKAALTMLNPSGANGFEGLLAIVLSKISGQTFRIAGSGSQHGKDGSAENRFSCISFEAKLYTGKIHKDHIFSKIAEIIASKLNTDLWVLCATSEIKTQILEPLETLGKSNGIVTLILDWSLSSGLPRLATVFAFAMEETVEFLSRNLRKNVDIELVKNSLEVLRNHTNYNSEIEKIIFELQDPTVGLSLALEKNYEWLEKSFSSRVIARQRFGQCLAPFDIAKVPKVERSGFNKTIITQINSTDEKIIALIGKEGCGKSWLFADVWYQVDEKPLTIVIPASAFDDSVAGTDAKSFFINKLIEQTGDESNEKVLSRWNRRFLSWKLNGKDGRSNLIVFIDGLNERPNFSWFSWLNQAKHFYHEYNIRIVVSSREKYFKDEIEIHLSNAAFVVKVEEWTIPELIEIFARKGMIYGELHPKVSNVLRNPRILSVAFDILDGDEIKAIRQLSVESLLFRHIQIAFREGSIREKPEVFKKQLTDHALEILNRIESGIRDDLYVFENKNFSNNYDKYLVAGLHAVSENQFFTTLQDDPTLYQLSTTCLPLALGLAIIGNLKKEYRNNGSVTEKLKAIIEPIASLDQASEILFAALQISVFDDRCSKEIITALISEYLSLQNKNSEDFDVFIYVISRSVASGLEALIELATSRTYFGDKDWLIVALRHQQDNLQNWSIIESRFDALLRMYSTDLYENGSFKRQIESSESRSKKKEDLDAKVQMLSSEEREFLKQNMRVSNLNIENISNDIFVILAGAELKNFAEAFICWSLSMSLNGDIFLPYKTFKNLIEFNRKDWSFTREALLLKSAFLNNDTISRTGKWALVTILRATGTKEDGEIEHELVSQLTAGRDLKSWRRVEDYCDTDPCDPNSSYPTNFEVTLDQCKGQKYLEISHDRQITFQDMFREDSLPALARFAPLEVIAAQREVAAIICNMDDFSYLINELQFLSPIFSSSIVDSLLKKAFQLNLDRAEGKRCDTQGWAASQYALMLGLSHINGNAQLQTLTELPFHESYLLQISEVFRAADELKLEASLKLISASENYNFQRIILTFACHSNSVMTNDAQKILVGFLKSEDSYVRACTLKLLLKLDNSNLIELFSNSEWSVKILNKQENFREIEYGSRVLVKSASLGLLSVEKLLSRISPEYFGFAAKHLGIDAAEYLIFYIDTSISRILNTELNINSTNILRNFASIDDVSGLMSVCEEEISLEESLDRFNESSHVAQERCDIRFKEFQKLDQLLTENNVRLAIENINHDCIAAVFIKDPNTVLSWSKIILDASPNKLRMLKNIGLVIAQEISTTAPDIACRLYNHLATRSALLEFTYGISSSTLEAECIWASFDSIEVNKIRSNRLDNAVTDHEISIEVYIALKYGKSNFISDYINREIICNAPARVARALTVCGFCSQDDPKLQIINQYIGFHGIIGRAAKAAKYAYERDQWSKYWFQKMCDSDSSDDFWRCSCLFLKIVDMRFQLWSFSIERNGNASKKFEFCLKQKLERRVKKWEEKRKKTLIGSEAPRPVFILAT